MSQIYCLHMKGNSVHDEITHILRHTAEEIIIQGLHSRRLDIKSLKLTGEISTRYKAGNIGAVHGIIFHAKAAWIGGAFEIEFIVRVPKGVACLPPDDEDIRQKIAREVSAANAARQAMQQRISERRRQRTIPVVFQGMCDPMRN